MKSIGDIIESAIKRMKSMTKDQFLESLVASDIYTESGKLKKKYRTNDSSKAARHRQRQKLVKKPECDSENR